ncbi:hypothetical protein CDAR_396031 [Caerostris darwini]|uniref:Uncharacterized protein n=1 Tax=Caerostris darwini TaxID=1538125 RepID=A0AAV4WMI9_9ARAC|nr:hypothetical protein CDAR_396031 [Caerostris darwini]
MTILNRNFPCAICVLLWRKKILISKVCQVGDESFNVATLLCFRASSCSRAPGRASIYIGQWARAEAEPCSPAIGGAQAVRGGEMTSCSDWIRKRPLRFLPRRLSLGYAIAS